MRISDWSSDVCSSDLARGDLMFALEGADAVRRLVRQSLLPCDGRAVRRRGVAQPEVEFRAGHHDLRVRERAFPLVAGVPATVVGVQVRMEDRVDLLAGHTDLLEAVPQVPAAGDAPGD